MNDFVALIRGINVGGNNKIKMADLKNSLAKCNFKDIKTYIQSGNVVFQSEHKDCTQLSLQITNVVLKDFGFKVPVLVRSKNEFLTEKEENPFLKMKDTDLSKLYVTFLESVPVNFDTNLLKNTNFNNDKFHLANKAIYLFFKDGYSQTKLTNNFWEKKLKIRATTRNWKTVCKISQMF